MVFLQKLRLFNYKNYEELNLELGQKIYCFFGKNGSGKTNLLDAIYYLSFTKSSISASDGYVVRKEENQFLVKGDFKIDSLQHEVTCSFSGNKKNVQANGQAYQKFSDHIGKFPVVLVAPQDIELIWDGSELRRRFFDSLISQLDRLYLEHLIAYTHQLKQRNSLLRLAEGSTIDRDLLASYDERLAISGNYIYKKRKSFVAEFLPVFREHYSFLSDSPSEEVAIDYKSELDVLGLEKLLAKNIERDILLQRTTSGIHRDDFVFTLNRSELKRTGSQGQQKSFLIGLKLTEFEVIAENKQLKPILLLDDIFDKLDDFRIRKLMILVAQGKFGQLFITDARPGRSREILSEAGIEAEIFLVDNGTVTKENG